MSKRVWLIILALFLTSGTAAAVVTYRGVIYFGDGSAASVSTTGTASIRYNNTSHIFEQSLNGASWTWLSPTSTLVRSGFPVATTTVVAGQAVYWFPFWVPPDVTQVRIRIANRTHTAATGAVSGVNLGVGTSNGAFGYSGSPTTYLGINLPADGTSYVSPWTAITRGSDGKIIIAYTVPAASTTVAYQPNIHWGKVVTGSTSVNPLPGGSVDAQDPIYTVHVEFNSSKRRIVVLGDSLSIGYDAALAVGPENAWPWKIARDNNWSVSVEGVSGSTMNAWYDDLNNPNFWDEQSLLGADVIIALGVNDLTETLDQMRARLTIMYRMVKSKGAVKVYTNTIPPAAAYSAQNATRVSYNLWLKGAPLEFAAIFDLDTALRDPVTPTQLLAANNAGDGTHWSVTGQATAESTILAGGL